MTFDDWKAFLIPLALMAIGGLFTLISGFIALISRILWKHTKDLNMAFAKIRRLEDNAGKRGQDNDGC